MHEVEPLRAGDYASLAEVRRMAFGDTHPIDPAAPHLPEDRFSCVYDGDRILASERTRGFGQWFGGRPVPCGGVSGVVIVTDRRREGLGKAVMVDALERMRGRGEVFSSLFATTAGLYRSLGYEVAGRYGTRRIALADLPEEDGSVDWRATRFDDPTVREVAVEAGRSHDGWLTLPEIEWAARQHFFETFFGGDIYVGTRDGDPVATVCVQYRRDDGHDGFEIGARVCSAIDGPATREALAFYRRHATTARQADFHLPPHVLENHVDPRRIEVVDVQPWMSRITDVAGALTARGWNPAVGATVEFHVDDPLFDDNAGPWRLTVAGGEATVERGGDGTARVGIGALSAWYTGYASPAQLRATGGADVDDPTAALMAAMVSGGEPPTVIDYF